MTKKGIVAVVCSDIHLSHKAPIVRTAEPDWYAAQKRVLDQVEEFCTEYMCPLIIAGDIFDDYKYKRDKIPPELINFAINNLPSETYAIPGQHDLIHHSYDDIEKTAYWTLVKAGIITNLEPGSRPENIGGVLVYGMPWGHNEVPDLWDNDKLPHVMIIHSYIWTKGKSYPGAKKEESYNSWYKRLDGFTSAFFGDNHKGFWFMSEVEDEPWIMNCGTLIRRKADEIDYEPQIGLLNEAGVFEVRKLDCSKDKFIDIDKALAVVEGAADFGELLLELKSLGGSAINFFDALKVFMQENNIGREIRDMVLRSVEEQK